MYIDFIHLFRDIRFDLVYLEKTEKIKLLLFKCIWPKEILVKNAFTLSCFKFVCLFVFNHSAVELGHLVCGKDLFYNVYAKAISHSQKKSTKSDLISVRKGLTSFFNSSRCVNTCLRGRNLTSEAGCVVMGRCLGDPVKQCISPTSVFLTTVLFPWLSPGSPQERCTLITPRWRR